MTTAHRRRVQDHVDRIYPSLDEQLRADITSKVIAAFGAPTDAVASDLTEEASRFRSDEVMLITYADTFRHDGQPHLKSLAQFFEQHLRGVFTSVHLLPFFSSSSDGGFAVVDYREVSEAVGSWRDIADLHDVELMFDLVCNHGSAQSEWFANFIADKDPGRGFYLTAWPDEDLSSVVRPRTHDLLLPVETASGLQHVWATFSHDQVDFDFANPDVLIEFCSVLGFYLDQGASRVRLDAIAYLWKELGTSCIHLPQTHEIVKLMRTLVEARDLQLLLITETNVPHRANVSYFGNGDEAHVVYNFTLAPLLVWSLVAGHADVLTSWLGSLAPLPDGCAFLNFIASHDGLGLRPVEDLIAPDELAPLIDAALAVGGDYSAYSAPGGPRPYELNVSLADLLAGPAGQTWQRFVVAHAAMLAVQGIPAIYVHSILASPGDLAAVAESGHRRDINRSTVDLAAASDQVSTGWRSNVFEALTNLIGVRRSHASFGPDANQTVHVLHPSVFAIERYEEDCQDPPVMALHNLSGQPVDLAGAGMPSWVGTTDLITGKTINLDALHLDPWQALWLC